MDIGTRVVIQTDRPGLATIVKPTKVNLPLPSPDWRIVRFDAGGKMCVHVSRMRAA